MKKLIKQQIKDTEKDILLKKSFPPLIDAETKILILGTMPGDESLRQSQYYAHPRNRFWKMIATITENDFPETYEEKKVLLQQHHIGVWDVIHSAERKGSLDTAILNETPNELSQLLTAFPSIKTICFNGKKAEALYKKHFQLLPHIIYHSLPSTSPANAAFSFDMICHKWKNILQEDISS